MASELTSLETLKDIKKIMEKSSRFISLSGWSGIAAGVCGMAGAFFIQHRWKDFEQTGMNDLASRAALKSELLVVAAVVFSCAFISAFLFTYRRSRREGVGIWGATAQRLLFNTMLPMIVGGIVILRLSDLDNYSLIVPLMLIFYGLALINGSKFTLGEIRYLGLMEIGLGVAGLWQPQWWWWLWTAGFGILHIIYGVGMWMKYDRNN